MPTKSNAAPQGFTPGPWRVSEEPHWRHLAWGILGPDNSHVADVPVEFYDTALGKKSWDDPQNDLGKANAALIARAPDLLAENERLRGALEECLPIIESMDIGREDDEAPIPLIATIRAALAGGAK